MTPDEMKHGLLIDELTDLSNKRAYTETWDEYYSQFNSPKQADAVMKSVAKRVKSAIIEAEKKDGTIGKYTNAWGFSYGIGRDAKSADAALRVAKEIRERTGERAGRGIKPPGLVKITEGQRPNRPGDKSESNVPAREVTPAIEKPATETPKQTRGENAKQRLTENLQRLSNRRTPADVGDTSKDTLITQRLAERENIGNERPHERVQTYTNPSSPDLTTPQTKKVATNDMPSSQKASSNTPEALRNPLNKNIIPQTNKDDKTETTDRRQDVETRKMVAEMTTEEMQKELLTSKLTGLPNLRAYEETPKKPILVKSDVDGLKWVNDELGDGAAAG